MNRNYDCIMNINEDNYYWPLNNLNEDYIHEFKSEWFEQDTDYLGLSLIKCWDINLFKKINERYPNLKGIWIECNYTISDIQWIIDIINLPKTLEIIIINNYQGAIQYVDLFAFPKLKLLVYREALTMYQKSKWNEWPDSLEYIVTCCDTIFTTRDKIIETPFEDIYTDTWNNNREVINKLKKTFRFRGGAYCIFTNQ